MDDLSGAERLYYADFIIKLSLPKQEVQEVYMGLSSTALHFATHNCHATIAGDFIPANH
jgi:hypothetical protein